jgi:DNA-binding NtrC family response regulator
VSFSLDARLLRAFATQKADFTPLAMAALLEYSWPGNVRQLRAAVERAALSV